MPVKGQRKGNQYKVRVSTVSIFCKHGYEAIIDRADYPKVKPYTWYVHKGEHGNLYVRCNVRNPDGTSTTVHLHHLVMNAKPGGQIDHKNNNGLDCRRENLRPAKDGQNQWNRRMPSSNSSGFKGVSFNKTARKFLASIRFNGRIYLGLFPNAREAAIAYDTAARIYHGEFACVNFPRPGENGAHKAKLAQYSLP
jgi:hypothetical protein